MRSRSGLAAVAVLVLVIVGSAIAFGSVTQIPGSLELTGLACPSTQGCLGVGDARNARGDATGMVVVVSHGQPGAVQQVPGTEFLNGACPQAARCWVIGNAGFSNRVVIFPVVNGRPGKPRPLALAKDNWIECGSADSCWVPALNKNDHWGVIHIVAGIPTKVYMTHYGGAFVAAACTAASTCTIVGFGGPSRGTVYSLKNGRIALTGVARVPSSDFTGVACPTRTYCLVAGFSGQTGVIASLRAGKLGVVRRVPGTSYLGPVACRSATQCFAFGGKNKNGRGCSVTTQQNCVPIVVPVHSGKPTAVQQIGATITGTYCNRTRCVGAGYTGRYSFTSEGAIYTIP